MESTFWGVEVKPGKAQPFVPPPMDAKLHLSQATLSMDAKSGTKVGVTCTMGEDGEEEVLLCSLREGGTESQSLDLIFDHYTEFKIQGDASVHLTGYYIPEYDEDDTDEDEDEDEDEDDEDLMMELSPEEAAALEQYQRSRHGPSKIKFGEDEEEDDDDDDDDDDEEDDDEDDDDDDEGIEDMIAMDAGNHITIVELNDDGTEKAESDEEEDKDEDEDDEDEDEEDEEDEDEEAAAEEAPRVIEVTTAREAAKRKAAGDGKQETVTAKKTRVEVKAVTNADKEEGPSMEAQEQQEEPQAAAGKKAKKGKNGNGASVLATWHPVPSEDIQNGNGPQAAAAEQKAGTQPSVAPTEAAIPIKDTRPNIKKFDNGFVMEDTHMGHPNGKMAKPGQKVSVRYRGTLAKNGKVFDETKGNKTFSFRLGVGEVIKGWDRGVVGMRVGDKRRLTVPPQMAYGTSGVRGTIPPNATLNFDVELVDVKGKA